MHAPYGIKYDIMYQDKVMHKDIFDIIAPKQIDEEGNMMNKRSVSNPTKIGAQLEIYHNCVH